MEGDELEHKKEEIKKLMKGKIKIKVLSSNRSNGSGDSIPSFSRNDIMKPESSSFVGKHDPLNSTKAAN